jgi:cell division protein FtsA
MSSMARDKIVSSIDIGTSKITTLIASLTDDGSANIVGVSTVTSRGIRKGQVVNIDEASQAISQSVDAAERMAGVSAPAAFVSVGGNHIASLNSHGVVAVAEPDKEISESDVNRVIDAAKAVNLPSTREILHVLPRSFSVDGQDGIVDPIGMTGVRLEVDTHLVTGGATAIRNLHKCVEELGVEVAGLVFSGLSSATAVVSDTEKELGVVLIDIGGGTTDVAVFVEGALSYSSVIPIGAINISKDLAAGLRISLESAEKIKLKLGQMPKTPAMPEAVSQEKGKAKGPSEDDFDVSNLNLPEDLRMISRKMLVEGIIKPRLNEIFTMVGIEIKKSGFGGLTPSGVVLTGGGAETVGALDAARRNLAMSVRIGLPTKVRGLIDEIMTPAYATSVGLLLYSAQVKRIEPQASSFFSGFSKLTPKGNTKGLAGKVTDLLKSFLP